MKLDAATIQRILLDGSYVTADDLKRAEAFSKVNRTGVIDYLLTENLITKDILGQAIAESFQVPYTDLNSNVPAREQVLKIPESVAKKFHVVLTKESPKQVIVTTDDPQAEGLGAALSAVFPNKTISATFSLSEDIEALFSHYHKELDARFAKIIAEDARVAPGLLAAIFGDAFQKGASDIHFEPSGESVLIRFRVDGVLQDVGTLPKEQYENVLNKIKVQSGIRLDEHFAAQDGAMQFDTEEARVDLRTSIVPTVEGEKAVLRLLNSYVRRLTLAELGLSPAHQKLLEEASQKPFGMIMVVGPTGSGKTTTLYALLKILNTSDVNITTIEDPVEYKVSGTNQIQVNAVTNLTFAKGLRSIVRQDPDIILVGEIRDPETAEIAVNAALTGHLLLSTFHANDAATSVPRLLDMHIEPFLLSSTLQIVVAQRLVRKICEHCRFSSTVKASDLSARNPLLARFFPKKDVTMYQGKGCEACAHSGYKGRTGIFECIRVTPELQELMLKHPSTNEVWALARSQGAQPLFEDGIEKVKNGVTTLDELLRVAEPPAGM